MKDGKYYNRLCVIAYVGVAICFVGFALSGFAGVMMGQPTIPLILLFFFGFGGCGFLASYSYRKSDFYARRLQDLGTNLGLRNPKEQQVVIRCRNCGTLNEENAKYCNQCGERL
jgi:hypothetical protein